MEMINIPNSFEEQLQNSINFDNPDKYYMFIVDKLLELKNRIKNDTMVKAVVEAFFTKMARWE